MFGQSNRSEDIFGVRTGSCRPHGDPFSGRPAHKSLGRPAAPPVIVEQPKSMFDLFGRRDDTFSPAALPRPQSAPSAEAVPSPAGRVNQPTDWPALAAAAERWLRAQWARMSVQQRLGTAVIAGWFLLASGLLVPAIIAGVIYFNLRRKPG
jgi:hypothetical protein